MCRCIAASFTYNDRREWKEVYVARRARMTKLIAFSYATFLCLWSLPLRGNRSGIGSSINTRRKEEEDNRGICVESGSFSVSGSWHCLTYWPLPRWTKLTCNALHLEDYMSGLVSEDMCASSCVLWLCCLDDFFLFNSMLTNSNDPYLTWSHQILSWAHYGAYACKSCWKLDEVRVRLRLPLHNPEK